VQNRSVNKGEIFKRGWLLLFDRHVVWANPMYSYLPIQYITIHCITKSLASF
jgi:hypothetical protein